MSRYRGPRFKKIRRLGALSGLTSRRCFLTGRPRANYRDFELSGHILREMVHACLLPGATRSSW